MSELTKALIQFQKDVDKKDKQGQRELRVRHPCQHPFHRHPGATKERSRPVVQSSLKTAS